MELRDFFEDDEMRTFKPEYNGARRREYLDFLRAQNRTRKREAYYAPNEYDDDGFIMLDYVATDEELWEKWNALKSGKGVFFLKGQFRRIMELRVLKMRAERQAQREAENQSPNPLLTSGT